MGGDVEAHIIIDHMQHIIDVAGEDFVSIGTDYDGAVVPPTDVRSVDCMPRLIQHMLDRGWSDTRIKKILAGLKTIDRDSAIALAYTSS